MAVQIGGVARVDYEQGRSQKATLSLDPMRPADCGRLTAASSIEDCCVRNDRLCAGTGACSSPVGCRARHHRGQGHRRVRGAVPGVLPLRRP